MPCKTISSSKEAASGHARCRDRNRYRNRGQTVIFEVDTDSEPMILVCLYQGRYLHLNGSLTYVKTPEKKPITEHHFASRNRVFHFITLRGGYIIRIYELF